MSVKIKKKKKTNTRVNSNLKRNMIISAVTGIIICFALIAVTAFIMTKTEVKTSILPYIYIAVGALSSFISGLIACRSVKHKKALISLASSLVIVTAMFVPIIAADNKDLSLMSLILIPAIILPGLLGGIISK